MIERSRQMARNDHVTVVERQRRRRVDADGERSLLSVVVDRRLKQQYTS